MSTYQSARRRKIFKEVHDRIKEVLQHKSSRVPLSTLGGYNTIYGTYADVLEYIADRYRQRDHDLSDGEVTEIIEHYHRHEGKVDIQTYADDYGTTREAISGIISDHVDFDNPYDNVEFPKGVGINDPQVIANIWKAYHYTAEYTSIKDIAKEHGVSKCSARGIIRGETYTYVTNRIPRAYCRESPPSPRTLSKEDVIYVWNTYHFDKPWLSQQAIADRLDVSRYTVRRVADQLGDWEERITSTLRQPTAEDYARKKRQIGIYKYRDTYTVKSAIEDATGFEADLSNYTKELKALLGPSEQSLYDYPVYEDIAQWLEQMYASPMECLAAIYSCNFLKDNHHKVPSLLPLYIDTAQASNYPQFKNTSFHQRSSTCRINGIFTSSNNEEFTSGVYALIQECDRTFYIGRSIHTRRRFNEHLRELESGEHINQRLQLAYDRSPTTLVAKVIEPLPPVESLQIVREQWWLDGVFKNEHCLNISPAACHAR